MEEVDVLLVCYTYTLRPLYTTKKNQAIMALIKIKKNKAELLSKNKYTHFNVDQKLLLSKISVIAILPGRTKFLQEMTTKPEMINNYKFK